MQRIVTNTSINYYRKQNKKCTIPIEDLDDIIEEIEEETNNSELTIDHLHKYNIGNWFRVIKY